jgi:AraC family transcriptional regulator, transcriptional activator FtrA
LQVAGTPYSVKFMPNVWSRALQNPNVVALAYDRLATFEFGIAVEVFGLPRPEMGQDWYGFAVAAVYVGEMREVV